MGERVSPGDPLPPPVMPLVANNCAVLGQGMLRSLCGSLCAWAGLAQHPLLISIVAAAVGAGALNCTTLASPPEETGDPPVFFFPGKLLSKVRGVPGSMPRCIRGAVPGFSVGCEETPGFEPRCEELTPGGEGRLLGLGHENGVRCNPS